MDRKDNPGRQDQSNNGTQPLEFVFEPVPADDERLKPNISKIIAQSACVFGLLL